MKQRIITVLGVLLIIFGLFIGSKTFLGLVEAKNSQPFLNSSTISKIDKNSIVKSSKPLVSGVPSHISIPSVGISIPVDLGTYNQKSQTWSLSLTDAEYATVTPEPNNLSGNTFIYGHNRWAVFYKLLKIQVGDTATVTTTNNHSFTYKLVSTKVTNPNDLSVFTYKGSPILTLQTCSGEFYQNRQFFVFNLVSYT